MLAEELRTWLAGHAESLDAEATHAHEVVPRLAQAGLFGLGVPQAAGGQGGSTADAVEAIAAVAGQSLAAAFVFWGQRSFIEYLLQSPNAVLRERALPALLRGEIAGASGLSNAMKYLGGIAELQVHATDAVGGRGWLLQGRVPWCTNLRGGAPGDFLAAVAVQRPGGGPPFVAALPAGRAGLQRSPDLDLIALRGSNTAALDIDTLPLGASDLLHPDANAWLPQVRPAFLALQCGLSIGLARAALSTAAEAAGSARGVLAAPVERHGRTLGQTVEALNAGLQNGSFVTQPAALFRLRLALADLAQQAVHLELLAGGGKAYHRDQPLSFARRWREAAFIPIVTPSVTQLQGALQAHYAAGAAQAATAS
ncbi:acyl-CoA dehydrogenase [Xylophilus sp. Leaf220]|nr:acyl-CoA dehydrogenase family protein [Xylophilus sp. Leaf220]KQM76399.1 acyl-CoA dehydrogenase [Xylophilus sp. Leaf220]